MVDALVEEAKHIASESHVGQGRLTLGDVRHALGGQGLDQTLGPGDSLVGKARVAFEFDDPLDAR